MNDITLLQETKKVTRKIYYLIIDREGKLKINQKNYFDIYVKCNELFENIFKWINSQGINKSLFLDFMNFQLQVDYCFEIITNKSMTTKEIDELMHKEKDYLDYTFRSITDIDLSEV